VAAALQSNPAARAAAAQMASNPAALSAMMRSPQAQAMMRQHRQGQEDARALQEAHGEAERRAAGMQELRVEIAALQQQVAALQQQAREDEVGLKRASEVLMDLQKVVMERDAAQDQARLAQLRVEPGWGGRVLGFAADV
jgi:chromosome segregation ATPase